MDTVVCRYFLASVTVTVMVIVSSSSIKPGSLAHLMKGAVSL